MESGMGTGTFIQLCYHTSPFYLSVWSPDKWKPFQQLYEGHFSLQHSKPHPNAVSRTKAKRNMSKLWSLGSFFSLKPIINNIKYTTHTNNYVNDNTSTHQSIKNYRQCAEFWGAMGRFFNHGFIQDFSLGGGIRALQENFWNLRPIRLHFRPIPRMQCC